MDLTSIQSHNYAAYGLLTNNTASTQNNSVLQNASGATTTRNADAADNFMNYAKETPAQRMFDTWLQQQNISKDEYNSMSSSDKEKLMEKYKEYLKEKMQSDYSLNGANTDTTATSGVNVSVSA